MDVLVEGSQVTSSLDVYADAGAKTAYMLEVVTACTDGSVSIELIDQVENPTISAIEVIYKGDVQCGIPKV